MQSGVRFRYNVYTAEDTDNICQNIGLLFKV